MLRTMPILASFCLLCASLHAQAPAKPENAKPGFFNLVPANLSEAEISRIDYFAEDAGVHVSADEALKHRCSVTVIVESWIRKGPTLQMSLFDDYSKQWFDPGGVPRLNNRGIHGWVVSRTKFESKSVFYFGLSFERKADVDGIFEQRYKIDKNNNPRSISYFDMGGKKAATQTGIHEFRYEYDDEICIRVRFLGLKGEKAVDERGACEERLRDKYSTYWLPYGLDGKILPGYPREREQRSLKADGNVLISRLDPQGRLLESHYETLQGKPAMGEGNWFRQTVERTGNREILRCFDIEGKPCVTSWGWHAVERIYQDERCVPMSEVSTTWLDLELKPIRKK